MRKFKEPLHQKKIENNCYSNKKDFSNRIFLQIIYSNVMMVAIKITHAKSISTFSTQVNFMYSILIASVGSKFGQEIPEIKC